jgi:hypothetical protein
MAGKRRRWTREYPPLLGVVIALFLVLAVLPSALSTPTTNPTETLEYAPIPPDDNGDPPPAGNLSSLGLAGSGSIDAPGIDSSDGLGDGVGGVAGNPSSKRCIGRPPRQTEDRLSPPCVAYFSGDNFGATYQGVTRAEVRIVMYTDCGTVWAGSSGGVEPDPCGRDYDLAAPTRPQDPDTPLLRQLRAFQRYFNERYQTYNRFVHFYVQFSNAENYKVMTPEDRKAEAAQGYARYKPFAVVTYNLYAGNEDVYIQAMARKGVLNFGAEQDRSEDFFRTFPKLIWGYPPTLEVKVRQYISYVCSKVVPHPASVSGNAGENGKPRILGLLWNANDDFPSFRKIAGLVRGGVQACGGRFATERTYTQWQNASTGTDVQTATENMADFAAHKVTTIIWPGGFETLHSKSATQLNYAPEWIVLGDGGLDGTAANRNQDQTAWAHAWVVSAVLLQPPVAESRCARAWKEADPQAPDSDVNYMCNSTPYYDSLRQLFTGIQVAGPRLSPDSIDKGFHAIPPVPSRDPTVPACFYEPGDYTCVKDAVAMWWDSDKTAPGATTAGCYRMAEAGRRYFTGHWPEGDITAQRNTETDPCNAFAGKYFT